MRLHNADVAIKALALNALVKLSVRFTNQSTHALVDKSLKLYSSSMNLELQQRSVEYSQLLQASHGGLRGQLLGKMPVLDEESLRKKRQAYVFL